MSSATAEARPEHRNLVGAFWRGFRDFRRSRPFWGGLLAMIAGVPILYFPYAHLSLGGVTIAMSTTAGAGSLIIGVLLIILGLTAWFQPAVRIFAGVATTLLTLVSIPVSNLAGFGMALLPGLIGGGLMMAWAKLPEPAVATVAEAAEGTTAESVATEQPSAAPAAEQSVAEQPVTEEPAAEPPAAGGTVPAQQAAEPKEVR
ncbi:hypothetical protein SAMN05216371_3067 [Streptomyces sp. TLI_053]|uniref:DUF6114 domain-containing protein n=1 Tax=Streptomyces sp. TLI_053 TaxID=1855352 RepID=UPI00087D6F3E|nr:DUF6114 domain-containing protein [Streptomyces sp. TLI_053]SDT59892.1 hypothetical protein SAMN05216371_3067 [Streptomyces sp. TLI_053]